MLKRELPYVVFSLFLIFLFIVYEINVSKLQIEGNVYKSFHQNSYQISHLIEIAFNKYQLIKFYKDFDFRWEKERELFVYFLILFFLSFLFFFKFCFFKLSKSKNFNEIKSFFELNFFNESNFYFLFFLYYSIQVFSQVMGINIFYPFFSKFVAFFYIPAKEYFFIFEMSLIKFTVILFALFVSPLLTLFFMNFLSKFNIFSFYCYFFYCLLKKKLEFVKLLLSALAIFLFFLINFVMWNKNEPSLLVIYITYGKVWELILAFFGLVIIVPLLEELIFRKYLIEFLLKLFSKNIAIVFSSIVFTVIHFETFFNSIFIFLMGIILGYTYLLKRDIVYTYFLHSVYNFLVLVYWLYFR